MRTLRALFVTSLVATSVVAVSGARAQTGPTSLFKPAPNVLLLVDSSGSMERKQNGQLPVCNPGAPGSTNERSKWIQIVEGLTGTVQNYSCFSWDRKKAPGSTFQTAYKINGHDPLDYGYDLPHVVPISGTSAATACGWGPAKAPGATTPAGVGPLGTGNGAADASIWDDTAIATFPFLGAAGAYGSLDTGAAASAVTCFDQLGTGQLDQAQDLVRLGLMTFDTDEGSGTGTSGTALNTLDPFTGGFSYLSGRAGPGPATVTLPACPSLSFEVGARNAYAPPWEGRMVAFPDWNATGTAPLITNSSRVQSVLLASRPYGATPIAGMLRDAQRYLIEDATGPTAVDQYVQGKCRDQFVILVTDGEATLDMRPACEAGEAGCPYDKSRDIVNALYGTAVPHIKTYVIGFSVTGTLEDGKTDTSLDFIADPTKRTCRDWFQASGGTATTFSAECTTRNPAIGTVAHACCSLAELAKYGDQDGPGVPLFAENSSDLSSAFSSIIASISRGNSTRALPAFGSSLGNTLATGKTGRTAFFLPEFTPKPLEPWTGDLVRSRQICQGDGTVKTEPSTTTAGDSLSAQLNVQAAAKTRQILTAIGAADGATYESQVSIRPFGADGSGGGTKSLDGLRTLQTTEVTFNNGSPANAVDAVHTETFYIDDGTDDCPASSSGTVPALTDARDCATAVLGFAIATPDSLKFATTNEYNTRCPGGSPCTAMGAIYHSMPTVTAQPLAFLSEPGYRAFADDRRLRPQIVYFATTDGLLHAFDTALDSLDESRKPTELFAFLPPASASRLRENYRTKGSTNVLDGNPVTKDTVWERMPADVDKADRWHTTLVAGLGQFPSVGSGYYAVDVSDVTYDPTHATEPFTTLGPTGPGELYAVGKTSKKGPHFLWQLTTFDYDGTGANPPGVRGKDSRAGKPMARLFGERSGTPAIATLFANPDATVAREIGVAILPGGYDDDPTKSGPRQTGANYDSCTRSIGTNSPLAGNFAQADKYPNLTSGTTYPARLNVRKWAANCDDPVAGRSLSIVRLDTGQILRTFARKSDVPRDFALATGPLTETPFDSPISGTPIPFPFAVGEVSRRIYVNDADGTIWSIDVSNPDPKEWKVGLFFDTASPGVTGIVDGDATGQANSSRPIVIPPVLSIDETGNTILNAAAGDPDQIAADASKAYVFSLRDRPSGALLTGTSFTSTELIWFKTLENGSRVTGPMAVFDRTLYFASFAPTAADVCGGGVPVLWGMDTLLPVLTGGGTFDPTAGGQPKLSTGSLVQSIELTTEANSILPGVAVRQVPSCSDSSAPSTVYGQSHSNAIPTSPTSFEIIANVPGKAGTAGNLAPGTFTRAIAPPDLSKVPFYDAWVTIVE